jgi:hypothetical protein
VAASALVQNKRKIAPAQQLVPGERGTRRKHLALVA